MSLKIWTAYRLKRGHKLWPALHDIRIKAEDNARKTLKKFYDALLLDLADPKLRLETAQLIYGGPPEATEKQKEERQKFIETQAAKEWTMTEARDYLRYHYRVQRAKAERNPFDLDVDLAIRHKGGRYYMIPYPGSGLCGRCLDFLRRHPALEDYHYQNQTDRPSHITAREWNERATVWDWLLDDDRWADKLVLNIVTYDGFERVDPWFKVFSRRIRDGMARSRKKAAREAKAAAKKTRTPVRKRTGT